MIKPSSIILLAFWTLVAMPTLCLGSVLEHPCEECGPEVSCPHEDGCASDPCSDLIRDESQIQQTSGSTGSLQIHTLSLSVPTDALDGVKLSRLTTSDRKHIPIPASDVPLRI